MGTDLHSTPLQNEKAAIVEQLRAADRSGRQAREEGQQLVREWQERHTELEGLLKQKEARITAVERATRALRHDLSAAQGRELEGAKQLKKMADMKEALTAQVAQLRAVDSRRQAESGEVTHALHALQARLQQSQVDITRLRDQLNCALEEKGKIESLLATRSSELASTTLQRQAALEAGAAKDGQLSALHDQLEMATETTSELTLKLQALEADYSAAASLLNKAQLSIAEHQKEQQVLEHKIGELEKNNSELRCWRKDADQALHELEEQLEQARIEVKDKSVLAQSGIEVE